MTRKKKRMRLPRALRATCQRQGVRNGGFLEIAKVGASTFSIIKDKGCAITNNKKFVNLTIK